MADYRENLHLARFQPPPDETYRLRAALREIMKRRSSSSWRDEGMIPREAFFNPANLERLMADVSPTESRVSTGHLRVP